MRLPANGVISIAGEEVTSAMLEEDEKQWRGQHPVIRDYLSDDVELLRQVLYKFVHLDVVPATGPVRLEAAIQRFVRHDRRPEGGLRQQLAYTLRLTVNEGNCSLVAQGRADSELEFQSGGRHVITFEAGASFRLEFCFCWCIVPLHPPSRFRELTEEPATA